MDKIRIIEKKNRVDEDNLDRMMDNLAEITASKMKTYVPFQQEDR